MSRFLFSAVVPLVALLVPCLFASFSFAQSNQDLVVRQQQDIGTPLYLDTPSCDFYQCSITWYPGDHVTAHWLDAPSGNVLLDMMTDAGATLVHHVATVPGTTMNCDAEGQQSCGQFSWVVPSAWLNGTTYGNYTLRATSESNQSIESYTDIILVKPANGTQAATDVPFSALDPTASSNVTATAASTVGGAFTTAPASNGTSAPASTTPAASASKATNSSASSAQGANGAASLSANYISASLFAVGTTCLAIFFAL